LDSKIIHVGWFFACMDLRCQECVLPDQWWQDGLATDPTTGDETLQVSHS